MRERLLGTIVGGRLVASGCSRYTIGTLELVFTGYVANADEFVSESSTAKLADDGKYYATAFAIAFERHGEALSEHLWGQYAVVIHDAATGNTLLSHDLLGLEPLYYATVPGELRFASDPAQLANDDSLDEDYIADYLYFGDHYGERTAYISVRRLQAARALQVTDAGLRRIDCSKILQSPSPLPRGIEACAEELRALLERAVRTALPRSGTTWCELSGGLDSSTVSGFAATIAPVGIETLSYVYSSSGLADERQYIDAVCDQWGLTNHQVDVDGARGFSSLPTRRYAMPNPSMINGALHSAIGRVLDADVVLTGMAGDAVLFGDGPEPFYLGDAARSGRFGDVSSALSAWSGVGTRRPVRYWLMRCVLTANWRFARRQVIQDQPQRVSWLLNDNGPEAVRSGQSRRTWSPPMPTIHGSWFFERVLRSANILSGWEFLTDFKRTEFRHPLLYVPLVRFMASLPPEFSFLPGRDRRLHRAAASGVLPNRIRDRRTKGCPDQAMYRGLESSEEWAELLLVKPQIVDRGWVDGTAWTRTVQFAKQGRCENIKLFRAAATLEAWLRQPRVARPDVAS